MKNGKETSETRQKSNNEKRGSHKSHEECVPKWFDKLIIPSEVEGAKAGKGKT